MHSNSGNPGADVPAAAEASVSYYRAALYLTAAIALSHVALFLSTFYMGGINVAAAVQVLAILVVLIGLWSGSSVARFAGGVLSLIYGTLIAWMIFGSGNTFGPFVAWGVVAVLLHLPAGYLLLMSKQFAQEFAHQRAARPAYKARLATALDIVIVVAIVAETAKDIHHVLSED